MIVHHLTGPQIVLLYNLLEIEKRIQQAAAKIKLGEERIQGVPQIIPEFEIAAARAAQQQDQVLLRQRLEALTNDETNVLQAFNSARIHLKVE